MRVLLVEDNDELASLLTKQLPSWGFTADRVATAEAADDALAEVHYGAVILDRGLPDREGLEVVKQMRSGGDPTPVLVLTARGGMHDRVSGLSAGADDYMVKPFATEELVARLRAILRRPRMLSDATLAAGRVTYFPVERQVLIGDQPVVFPAAEVALLELLLRQQGQAISRWRVEDQLFGAGGDVSGKALDVLVHRLRKRLAGAGADVEIITIRGVGYFLRALTDECAG
jgi:DNA-binding response OmpR family regulator